MRILASLKFINKLDNNLFKISRAPWKEWHPLLKWEILTAWWHVWVWVHVLGHPPPTQNWQTYWPYLSGAYKSTMVKKQCLSQGKLELFTITAMGCAHNSKQDGSHQVNMQKWDLLYFENHWPEEGSKRIQTQSFYYYYSFKVTAQVWIIPS